MLHDEAGLAWHMAAHVIGERAGIGIEAAARRKADDHLDLLAGVEAGVGGHCLRDNRRRTQCRRTYKSQRAPSYSVIVMTRLDRAIHAFTRGRRLERKMDGPVKPGHDGIAKIKRRPRYHDAHSFSLPCVRPPSHRLL